MLAVAQTGKHAIRSPNNDQPGIASPKIAK